MKKLLSIFAMLLLISGAASAQKLKLGLQGGFNRANVSTDTKGQIDVKTSVKNSFNGGLYAQLHFFDGKFIIQPEMMYSKEGFVYTDSIAGTTTTGDVKTRLNFMNVPMTFIFKPVKLFNLQIGPDFGLLAKALRDKDTQGATDPKELFKKAEMGLNLGIGFTLMKFINVNLRYNYGLTSLTKSDVQDVQQDPLKAVSMFNRMFQMSVGLNLFGKKVGDTKASLEPRHFKANRYLINI